MFNLFVTRVYLLEIHYQATSLVCFRKSSFFYNTTLSFSNYS